MDESQNNGRIYLPSFIYFILFHFYFSLSAVCLSRDNVYILVFPKALVPGCNRLGDPVKREIVRKKRSALEIIYF